MIARQYSSGEESTGYHKLGTFIPQMIYNLHYYNESFAPDLRGDPYAELKTFDSNHR